jgi:hypothetical protein
MGTPLTGSTVASTYTGLLKTADNAALTASLKAVSDGSGIDSALQVSTTAANINGNLTVATNKLTVASASGNTAIAGTLNVTGAATLSSTLNVTGATTVGSLSTAGNISTSAGTISSYGAISQTQSGQNNSLAGNLSVGGNLNVTGVTTFTGNLQIPGNLGVTGNFAVNTNKFTVAASSGDTVVAGTLGVTGLSTLGTLSVTGASTLASASITGAATIGTTLGVTGATTLGDLSTTGNTTLGNQNTDTLALNSDNITVPNLSPVTIDLSADKVLITDANDSSKVKLVAASALGITSSNAPQCVQQVYRDVTTAYQSSSTNNGEEITQLTATITPRSTSSNVLVTLMINYGATPLTSQYGAFRITRNGIEIGSNNSSSRGANDLRGIEQCVFADNQGQNIMNCVKIQFLDSPSSSSAVTYKVHLYGLGVSGNHAVIYINQSYNDAVGGNSLGINANARASSSMILQEYFA